MTPERKRTMAGLISAVVVSTPFLGLAFYIAPPLVGAVASAWGILCGYLLNRSLSPSVSWILPWGIALVSLPLIPGLVLEHWWPGGALVAFLLCSLMGVALGHFRGQNGERSSKSSPDESLSDGS